MKWIICFSISMAIFAAAIIYAILKAVGKYKRGRILTPFNVLFFGIFLSSFTAVIPIYGEIISQGADNAFIRIWETFTFSLHHTFQLFTLDVDRDIILNNINCDRPVLKALYSFALSVAIVVAPALTFGFVVSFFKNLSAYFRYVLHRYSNVYIFSELNEESLALGKSIKEKDGKNLIVYTDVFENNEELSYERAERARELHAICFKKDILTVNFKRHAKNSFITFFVIGEDETENATQTIKLAEIYKDRKNTKLFVFSKNTESELLLNKIDRGALKIRRVNKIRSVINRLLDTKGVTLFENAKQTENGEKTISAVIIGTGLFGTEMLKALTWYCQMDGYKIVIDVFGKDKTAEDRFSALAPEIMDKRFNGKYIHGEPEYRITFHPGYETGTRTFEDEISKLKDTTFAFVCLGTDADNIKASVELRTVFERMHIKPRIQTVVFDSNEKRALEDATNFSGQPYDISVTGDIDTMFSEDVVVNSKLENEALQRHLKWGGEEAFWKYEYNYNSSVATALHRKARIACGIPGADKAEGELTEEERQQLELLEHRRWNAYMRCEGYIYSGSREKSSRNNLGKMHHDLVEFDVLSENDKRKDSKVGSK